MMDDNSLGSLRTVTPAYPQLRRALDLFMDSGLDLGGNQLTATQKALRISTAIG